MSSRYLLPLFLAVASYAVAQDNATEFFEARIRPVLADKCYACHTASKLGELRLDSRDAMLQGGKSGPAIVPGKPDESRLIRAVKHMDPRLKMPMAGDKLSEREIADLVQWIQAGAPWPEPAATSKPADAKKEFAITAEQKSFWSFQPLRKPPLPDGQRRRLDEESYRSLHPRQAGSKGTEARQARRQAGAASPRQL